MRNIFIAPNELKGSLTAREAALAIEAGIHSVNPSINTTLLPISDGGDGLLGSLQNIFNTEIKSHWVNGPIGDQVEAKYLYVEDEKLAIIEMAEAVGLRLLNPDQYDAINASTYGVGQLILAALDQGAENLLLGIGGSATSDGGMGLAIALGVEFLDENDLPLIGSANELKKIRAINMSDIDPRIKHLRWQVACDVDNPLLGEYGAAAVYGPQKGADVKQVALIEEGLSHFAEHLEKITNKDIRNIPGAGAAGGLGAGLMALFNVDLKPGAEHVFQLLDIESHIATSDLVITAEGKLDAQTVYGKAPGLISQKAKSLEKPCLFFAGQVDEGNYEYSDMGITAAFEICDRDKEIQYSIENAASLLKEKVRDVFQNISNVVPDTNIASPIYQLSNKRSETMIKKCLFPAAGYGTRFLPATKAMPKEILPVMEKPLIQYGVEEAMEAGMDEIAIITGRGKRAIEDHFDTNFELEHQISGTSKEGLLTGIRSIIDKCTFSYTRQIAMRGLGDAILCGETLIGHEPFGVILADDLCEGEDESVLKQMADIYEKYRCCVIAIQEVDPEEVYKYGVIAGRELDDGVFIVSDMVEKPEPEDAPSNLAIIGRYILTPNIFESLRNTPPGKNDELQLTDALQHQAKENMVIGYKFKGKRFDCGSLDGYVDATNYFYNKRK